MATKAIAKSKQLAAQAASKGKTLAAKAATSAVDNPKIVIGIVGITVAFFVAKSAISWVKDMFSTPPPSDHIDDIVVEKAKMSISENAANIRLQNIFTAMNQYGTDEDTIIANLRNLNKHDILYLIKTFGQKLYNGFGEATNRFDRYAFSTSMGLIGWLKAELSGSNLQAVQQLFTQNNIPF